MNYTISGNNQSNLMAVCSDLVDLRQVHTKLCSGRMGSLGGLASSYRKERHQ